MHESPTTEVLTSLARECRFVEARAYSEPGDKGSFRFAPDKCLLVWCGNY